MDVKIYLDCASWDCLAVLYDSIVDLICRNRFDLEVRAFGDVVGILDVDDYQYTILSEYIPITLPKT